MDDFCKNSCLFKHMAKKCLRCGAGIFCRGDGPLAILNDPECDACGDKHLNEMYARNTMANMCGSREPSGSACAEFEEYYLETVRKLGEEDGSVQLSKKPRVS